MAVTCNTSEGIAEISLVRPEKLNALDPSHLKAFRNELTKANADPVVRVIVITGTGRAFSVGADLAATAAPTAGFAEAFGYDLDGATERGLYVRLFNLASLQIRKPLIAAVNGFCLGGGLELALQCDLIVAAESASFGLPEVSVGSIPGAGGVPALMRAIPRAIAMRMLLTGAPIDAARAFEVGLISDVWPDPIFQEEALKLARDIAAAAPLAVQMVKMLATQSQTMTTEQGFQSTELAWGIIRDTEDRREGRRAFNEKRRPQYVGR